MNSTSPKRWYALEGEDVLQSLESESEGLTQPQTNERTERFGKTVLPGKWKVAFWEVVLHQMMSPFIYY